MSATQAEGARPAARTTAKTQSAGAAWPSTLMAGVHIAALWAIAFVQPLFDLLGKNAAFFVARDNTPGDILIFAFGFALGPPLVALLVLLLARRVNERLFRVLHLAVITFLAGVLLMQFVKGLSGQTEIVLPLSLALGGVAAWAYAKFAGLRTVFSVLGVAPVVFLALLLLFSPVGDVVMPSDEASSAPSGAAAAKKIPVVVLIYDELPTISLMKRDKTVDAERFPNFARLAKTSTWYQNATSVSDGTYVAVPSILTGLRPKAELPTSRSYPRNLYTMLGKTYSMNNQEPITSVCPQTLCTARDRPRQKTRLLELKDDLEIVEKRLLLPDEMIRGLPPIDRDWEAFRADTAENGLTEAAERRAPEDTSSQTAGKEPIRIAGNDLPAQRARAARAVVRTMKPGSKPGLWMVHNVVPHVPWRFLPDGSQYVVEGPTLPGLNDDQTWGSNRFLLDQAYQRHFQMMRFADRLLGDQIDQMKRTGLWDDALVILVADHGGAIGAKESRRPVVGENFDKIAGVPFFVKMPGQKAGAVDQKFVTTMDVLPTVAKTLGVKTDWKFDGIPVDEPHPETKLQQRNGRLAKLITDDTQSFARERDKSLAEQARSFPPGLKSLWRIGPQPELMGDRLNSLTVQDAGGESATIDSAKLYRKVRPASGVIPAYVTGETKGIAPGTAMAVAVNGTIRASGVAYSEHGDPRYSFLLPPEVLKRGRNSIEVLTVRGRTARIVARAG